MRSYTNNEGMLVTVDLEHLNKAVDIKIELQESSPARRTNWKKHKELMELEGFIDSDINENYRCMIKDYQKQIGKLAAVNKYVDLVSESKLNAIKVAVGEIYHEKQNFMKVKRELNKVKRDLSKSVMVAEEVKNAFLDDIHFDFPHYVFSPRLPKQDIKAVVCITDWHIGAIVNNVKGNSYNFEIAQKRIGRLKQKVLDYCNTFGINDITVAMLGDAVEHISMRNINQSFEAEFPLGEQIVKATRLITDFIVSLSEYKNVSYFGIAGNHDRLQSNKADAIDGDNVMVIINENIKNFIDLANIPRLTFEENNDSYNYEYVKEINGKRIKFLHGDIDFKNDKNKLEKHMAADEQIYDAIVFGHYHHYEVIERSFGRLEIYVGSPMGRNTYARKIKASSNAGQAMLIITNDEILPIRIDLQEV